MKILFFDLETTGLSPVKHGIHQISMILDVDGKTKEKRDFKVKPWDGAAYDRRALEIGNVTQTEIAKYPDMMEVYGLIEHMLDSYVQKYDRNDKFFLSGYNNSTFDNPFLRNFFARCGNKYFGSYFWATPLDVRTLSFHYLRNVRHQLSNFKLSTVASYMGIKVEESKLHDAMYDVALTREIYYKVSPGLESAKKDLFDTE